MPIWLRTTRVPYFAILALCVADRNWENGVGILLAEYLANQRNLLCFRVGVDEVGHPFVIIPPWCVTINLEAHALLKPTQMRIFSPLRTCHLHPAHNSLLQHSFSTFNFILDFPIEHYDSIAYHKEFEQLSPSIPTKRYVPPRLRNPIFRMPQSKFNLGSERRTLVLRTLASSSRGIEGGNFFRQEWMDG